MMKNQLNRYINEISKRTIFDWNGKDVLEWTFRGDGFGDFEDMANSVKKELLPEYIESCKKQIELAEEYLSYLEEKTF